MQGQVSCQAILATPPIASIEIISALKFESVPFFDRGILVDVNVLLVNIEGILLRFEPEELFVSYWPHTAATTSGVIPFSCQNSSDIR